MKGSPKYSRWWGLFVCIFNQDFWLYWIWLPVFLSCCIWTPPLGVAWTGGAGHLFDSRHRGHVDPQVQVAKRQWSLFLGSMSGLHWRTHRDYKHTAGQLSFFRSFFPSLLSKLLRSGLYAVSPRSTCLWQVLYQPCQWGNRRITGCTQIC